MITAADAAQIITALQMAENKMDVLDHDQFRIYKELVCARMKLQIELSTITINLLEKPNE
jgi:hypothetical protein